MRGALVRRRLIGIGDILVGRCLSLNNHVALVKELNVAILHGVHSFALLRILCIYLILAVWNIQILNTR